jgi:hypothetical protein
MADVDCPYCAGELWADACDPDCPNAAPADRRAWKLNNLHCPRCQGHYGATRSQRVAGGTALVECGGADRYEPRCRGCWTGAAMDDDRAVAAPEVWG